MPRKHHTSSEALLQAVIEDLQSDNPRGYAAAVHALVSQGPLRCVALRPDVAGETDELIRLELWAFLRELVRLRGVREDVFGIGIWLNDHIRLVGNNAGPHVTLGIEATRRTIAILNLAVLLDRVGLDKARLCGARDCPGIFIKTYRREFCSVQCQKRHYMRKLRADARETQRRRQQQRRMKG